MENFLQVYIFFTGILQGACNLLVISTLLQASCRNSKVYSIFRQLIFIVGNTNKSLGINHWEIPSHDKDVIHYFIVLFIATIESGIHNK